MSHSALSPAWPQPYATHQRAHKMFVKEGSRHAPDAPGCGNSPGLCHRPATQIQTQGLSPDPASLLLSRLCPRRSVLDSPSSNACGGLTSTLTFPPTSPELLQAFLFLLSSHVPSQHRHPAKAASAFATSCQHFLSLPGTEVGIHPVVLAFGPVFWSILPAALRRSC